jgi:hypothetical protein
MMQKLSSFYRVDFCSQGDWGAATTKSRKLALMLNDSVDAAGILQHLILYFK